MSERKAFVDLDAHVHLYDVFRLDLLLRTAVERAYVRRWPLLLLLAESEGYERFLYLRDRREQLPTTSEVDGQDVRGFRFVPLADGISLRLETGSGVSPAVFVVSGRQFVSREGIEVLALGLAPERPLARLPDRSVPLDELLERSLEAGAATVLPWGVGKWLGQRGRRVREVTERTSYRTHGRFFMGDSAHRCWPWPEPRAFRTCRVLCGTDPLPLPGCERRVASFGTRVHGSIDMSRPGESLLELLDRPVRLDTVGRRQTWLVTASDQFRYRWIRGASRS